MKLSIETNYHYFVNPQIIIVHYSKEPRIEHFPGKKLVGERMIMSLANNKTGELWRSFITAKNEINNIVGTDLYSVQTYSTDYFTEFNPAREFEKWATVEVNDFGTIPPGMDTLALPAGLYAVFIHRGAAATGAATFQYIFGTWLPQSVYKLDDRPHFEVLGEKYKNDSPGSEEEIWIPVSAR